MARRRKPRPDRQQPSTTEVASTNSAPTKFSSFAIVLASICGLAFFLRCMNVMQTIQVPTLIELLGDARGYFEWAVRISDGDWYGTETFYQAPLYPYFLAVLIKVFGPSITAIRLVQMMLGVAGVALIGLAGRKLFSERIGLVSALMLAVYPPAIYYDGIIQKAAVATFLLSAFLAACIYLQCEKRWWYAVLTGATLGLLVLARENALLWTPLVPFWILLGISETKRRRWTLIGCYVGGLALILLPVAARNASLGGEWSPTTFQAGPNFYIGNNLQANGIYIPLIPGHGTPMYERADAERLAEQAVGHELSAREVSKYWMSKSWEEIRQSPSHWLQLMVAKTFMVFNRYEVPDVESMYIFREYSAPLKLSRIWHFGILCPLGIWGVIATWKDWRKLWLYYLLLLSMIAAVVGFFILGRYRNPVAILLIPLAAAGVVDLIARFKEKRWRSISVAAVLILSGIFCNIPCTKNDPQCQLLHEYGDFGLQVGQPLDGHQPAGKCDHRVSRNGGGLPQPGEGLHAQWPAASSSAVFSNALTLDPRLLGVTFQLGEALSPLVRKKKRCSSTSSLWKNAP